MAPLIASLRYLDRFVKINGVWLFAQRQLYVDWLEGRALSWRATLRRASGGAVVVKQDLLHLVSPNVRQFEFSLAG